MSFECEHCHNILKTKYILENHLKNNKSCLKLRNETQEKNIYKYLCDNCDYKTINKSNFNRHKINCIKKTNTSLIKTPTEYELLLKEKDIQLQEKNKQLEDYKKQIEKLQETIAKIAEQPKIVTTTNNTNQTLTKNTLHQDLHLTLNLDKDIVRKQVEEKYTLGHYYKGPEGVAKFCYDNILCDEKGECRAGIADANRGTIKYKNNAGNIVKDPGCTTLIDLIYPPVFDKSTKFLKSEMEKHMKIIEEKEGMERVNAEAMNQYNQSIFLDIKEMQNNNKIKRFRDPLIKQVLNKDNMIISSIKNNTEGKLEEEKLINNDMKEEEEYKEEEIEYYPEIENKKVYNEGRRVYRTIAEEIEDVPQEIIDRDNRILDEIDKESKYVNKNKKWKR
jgi:hypothetical protein